MKTAREWFETLGEPIIAGPGIRRHPQYQGFRAFTESDIAEIQRDALATACWIINDDGNHVLSIERIEALRKKILESNAKVT